MNSRLYINIKDWYESAKAAEVDIQTTEDIARLILDGTSPRQVGEWIVALIHNEESPPDLLPSAKELLSGGAYGEVRMLIQTLKERLTIRLENGEERGMTVRRVNHWGGKLVSAPSDETDVDQDAKPYEYESGYAGVGDSRYLENATRRLHGVALGYARNALAEILVGGGDAAEEWSQFKREGDELLIGMVGVG